MDNWNKSQGEFAREFARQLLVKWADESLRHGSFTFKPGHEVYVSVAQERKWVGKRGPPYKVTAAGFKAAKGFLKR